MHDSTTRRLVAWAARLLALGGLSFVGLELGVRLLGLTPPAPEMFGNFAEDPVLPWRPSPFAHSRGSNPTGEFEYDMRNNSQGFWDEEHHLEKPEGTLRILGIGDSFTLGFGAAYEETWLARLEADLNADRDVPAPVEVIKMGVGRFWPAPERLLLEHHGLAYDPDLVLVLFVPNDVHDTYVGVDGLTLSNGYLIRSNAERFGPIAVWLSTRSDLVRLLLARAQRSSTPYFVWPEMYRAGGRYESVWSEIEREYEGMVDLARGRGTEIVFIHVPQGGDFMNSIPREWWTVPAERLSRWANRHGVHFVDAQPAFTRAMSDEMLYWPLDGHPTPAGYRVLAETVAGALKDRGLLREAR